MRTIIQKGGIIMRFDFKGKEDRGFILKEIERFRSSERRRDMILGEDYYSGKHDILYRNRMVVGEKGELEQAYNLPDNKAVDNQYRKLVNQKSNYLLGRPLTFRTDDDGYYGYLSEIFDRRFLRLLKNLCKDVYNHGIGWLYPEIRDGKLRLKRLKGYELIPGWRDFEHTELDYAIRIYEVVDYSQSNSQSSSKSEAAIIERVEVFDDSGIHYFELSGNELIEVAPYHCPYITCGEISSGWEEDRVPLIAFKRDSCESALINSVKSLQDGLNLILSNFWNAMEEDPRNTLLVLVNYDGEDLGEFRRNLAAYGAVKVRSIDGAAGDLKTLRIEVNAENYRTIIEIFKKAMNENGMGFDAKDSLMVGRANQMNIQSMYSDVDLDANEIETEFQASLTDLMWYVEQLTDENVRPVEFIFNRDMLLNESAIIDDCVKSLGILSRETVIANHPWVDDVGKEVEKSDGSAASPSSRSLDSDEVEKNVDFRGGV
ncbi:MAG: phage portal protein [Oscillospiraceae bacterium]|nr:phage portal protein [Oscillospiraceae bacterium]